MVIRLGDTPNAWNASTHDVAPAEANFHLYTDGDGEMRPNSIAGFADRSAEPEAWGCAALPVTGRSRDTFRAMLKANRWMAGNRHAPRRAALLAFRETGLRLPCAIFGEDGLVSTLVKGGLARLGPRVDTRLTVTEQGGFACRSSDPSSLRDPRIYRNCKRRYALRQLQAEMLHPLLLEKGVGAMPEHVVDLYRARFGATRLGWRGLATVLAWEARQRVLWDLAKADKPVKAEDRVHLQSSATSAGCAAWIVATAAPVHRCTHRAICACRCARD